MDALQFFALRYDAIHTGFVDDILGGLSDDQLRMRPHGLNSIAWLLWQAARVEDVAVNRFVADRPQVLVAEDWNGRLAIERRDIGVGMAAAEEDELSHGIHLARLRGYWDAVARGTTDVISELSPADLEATVDPARVNAVLRDEDVLVPSGEWVADVWGSGWSRGWFLQQTALLHPYGHLFDCMAVRGLVT